MERAMSEMLRAYAEKLEDKTRIVNVESCRRIPELDQRMLLAVNRPWEAEGINQNPDAGVVMEWLRTMLISVSTSDQQGAVLGLFYTNLDPFNSWQKKAVGIFPVYNDITEYSVVPHISTRSWESKGEITIQDGPGADVDPFVYPNPKGPNLVFFRQNPFDKTSPYRTEIPDPEPWYLPSPTLQDNVLEENVIDRALHYVDRRRDKPRLFTQEGFYSFIGSNRGDPKYADLYRASRLRLVGSSPMRNF